MVKALGSSEEAVFLQHRLDDMNQRWSDLKTKSANIRSVKALNLLTFAFSSLLGHGCQIAVFCPFAALKLRRKKDILA